MAAIRSIERLHPELALRYGYVQFTMAGLRHPIRQTETVRPIVRQQEIWERGRTTSGVPCRHDDIVRPIGICDEHPLGLPVTNATPGKSMHTPRLLDGQLDYRNGLARAVDFFFDAPEPWSETHPWRVAGELGEVVGLVWGGRWTNPRDLGHLQWEGR